MGARRRGRELALQALYLADVSKLDAGKALRGVCYDEPEGEKSRDFARRLTEGVLARRAEIDDAIARAAENWEVGRMAALDRNIMRIGAYELLHEADTPVSVVIDEAVEIAKTYSTEESGKFVNGILDKIKLERPEGAPKP